MTRVLAVGDIHVRLSTLDVTQMLTERLVETIEKTKPDLIVLLGDLLNDFSRMHLQSVAALTRMLSRIAGAGKRVNARVLILVGNHDIIANSQFLPTDHALVAFKDMDGVEVIDMPGVTTIRGINIGCVPYVPPGRFREACDLFGEAPKPDIIFCHQEFRGAKLGPIISTIGDVWPVDFPPCYSGHIHERDRLQENVTYIGTPFQQAFSEQGQKTVSLLELKKSGWDEQRIDLGLPRRIVVNVPVDQINEPLKFEERTDWLAVRINVDGPSELLSKFKNSKRFTDLKKKAQIICRPTDMARTAESTAARPRFLDLVRTAVENESELVQKTFEEVVRRAHQSGAV